MSHFDVGAVYVLEVLLLFQIDQDLVEVDRADLLVAVSGGFAGGGDQSTAFQFLDMAGERSVGDVEARSQLVHAHAVVLEQDIQNFDADIRTKCFKDVQPIIQ